jgi:hypothetical protein
MEEEAAHTHPPRDKPTAGKAERVRKHQMRGRWTVRCGNRGGGQMDREVARGVVASPLIVVQ